MFTIFSLRKSQNVSDDERREFIHLLEQYESTPIGDWLTCVPWRLYQIKWCPAMKNSGGVMGAFTPWLGKKIFLMPSNIDPLQKRMMEERGLRDSWLIGICPVLIHELRHVYQFSLNPAIYIACTLPGIRQFTIENDAVKTEKQARKFFAAVERQRCAAEFNARFKKVMQGGL